MIDVLHTVVTNGDMVAELSSEEFAEMLKKLKTGGCPPGVRHGDCDREMPCGMCWREWLEGASNEQMYV